MNYSILSRNWQASLFVDFLQMNLENFYNTVEIS